MAFIRCLLGVAKFAAFTSLLFCRPFIRIVFGVATKISLICLLFIAAFERSQTTPMFAFLYAGLASTAILWLYDELLKLVGPDGFEIVTSV